MSERIDLATSTPATDDELVARPAARAIAEQTPAAVRAAVIDFTAGTLIENPKRVGRELRNEPEYTVVDEAPTAFSLASTTTPEK